MRHMTQRARSTGRLVALFVVALALTLGLTALADSRASGEPEIKQVSANIASHPNFRALFCRSIMIVTSCFSGNMAVSISPRKKSKVKSGGDFEIFRIGPRSPRLA